MEKKIVKTPTDNFNFDSKNHRVGGDSEYDNDIDLIEIMVSYSKNKKLDDSIILSYYYISKIMIFWNAFKEYLYTDEIILNHIPRYNRNIISKYSLKSLNDRINNNKKKYNKEFTEFIKKIPTDLINYINNENLNNNFYSMNAFGFAFSKLKEKNLYKYLREYLTKDEIYNIFNLPENYDENQIIIDTTIDSKSKAKYIRENIDYYENIYYKKLDKLNDNIYNNELFDNILYYDMFKYIANLNCLNLLYFNKNYNNKYDKINYDNNYIDLNNVYIIANGTGIFALNTWLYSFFEGITLLGTSIRETYADNNKTCAFNMLAHDADHVFEIGIQIKNDKGNIKLQSLKKLYYNILNSRDLDIEQKELFIFILFINIHEIYNNGQFITFNLDFNFLFKKYLDYFDLKFPKEVFLPELQKFYYNIKKHYNDDLINNYKNSLKEFYPKINFIEHKDLIDCLIYIIYMLKELND